MAQILEAVRAFDGALVFTPDASSGAPEIAWGDSFCYFAPDGQVPQHTQPYATIVTKDYPDDTQSALDGEGRYRVNIHVARERFVELTGEDPKDIAARDFATAGVVLPHPVYGAQSWVCVVNPGDRTLARHRPDPRRS